MTKKLSYKCSICGATSINWVGYCSGCNSWNSYEEEGASVKKTKIRKINEFKKKEQPFLNVNDLSLVKVIGNKIHLGSNVLLGGQPGAGKSTLLCKIIKDLNVDTLYVCGEETSDQVSRRFIRLECSSDKIALLDDRNISTIEYEAKNFENKLIIIDSIQTLEDSSSEYSKHSVQHLRMVLDKLINLSKKYNITLLIVCQVNKDTSFSGPKTLEHMVDTVLSLEKTDIENVRLLKAIKNRFYSTSSSSLLTLSSRGFRNYTQIFNVDHKKNLLGSSYAISKVYDKTFVYKTEALIDVNKASQSKTVFYGVDTSRVNILIAIINKYIGRNILADKDLFISLPKTSFKKSRLSDLSIITSILSSSSNVPLAPKLIFIGEVSLSGEVNAITCIDDILLELKSMGFNKVVCNYKSLKRNLGINVCKIESVSKLPELLAVK